MRPHPLLIQLAMVLTMVLWGVSFVASKIVLDQIGPLPYMGIRFSLAALVLAILIVVVGRPHFSPGTHALIALTALSEPIAYFLFESYGLRIIGATTTSLIIALVPLAVMILAALFLHEKMHLRGVLAVLVSISGIVLLVYGPSASAVSTVAAIDPLLRTTGVLLVLGAVFSAAGYITLARSLTQKHDPDSPDDYPNVVGGGVFCRTVAKYDPGHRNACGTHPGRVGRDRVSGHRCNGVGVHAVQLGAQVRARGHRRALYKCNSRDHRVYLVDRPGRNAGTDSTRRGVSRSCRGQAQ